MTSRHCVDRGPTEVSLWTASGDHPDRSVLRGVLDLHGVVTTDTRSTVAHLALALSRPGPAEVSDLDEEWADVLEDELGDLLDDVGWSLHVAATGRVTELVSRP